MRINNDNLLTILNFITSNTEYITFFDLINYCISVGIYQDLYANQYLIERVLNEHNKVFEQ